MTWDAFELIKMQQLLVFKQNSKLFAKFVSLLFTGLQLEAPGYEPA